MNYKSAALVAVILLLAGATVLILGRRPAGIEIQLFANRAGVKSSAADASRATDSMPITAGHSIHEEDGATTAAKAGGTSESSASSSAKRGTLAGRIVDRISAAALAGARVSFVGKDAPAASAIADGEGRFRFDAVPAGIQLQAMAVAEGRAPEYALVQIDSGGTGLADFELGPAGTLEATVRDSKMKPVEGATVAAGRPGFPYAIAKTDANGLAIVKNLSVSPLPQVVRFWKAGYRTPINRELPEFDERRFARTDLILDSFVHRTLTFFGAATDPGGKPLAGIEVSAGSSISGQKTEKTTTGADGSYRIGPIDVADLDLFFLRIAAKGWAPATKRPPELAEENSEIRVDFKLEPGSAIGGRVLDEDKNPIAGVAVATIQRGPGPSPAQAQSETTTTQDGEFRFEDQAQNGRYLFVYPPGVPAGIQAPVRAGEQNEIVVKRPGSLRGQVVDAKTKLPVALFNAAIVGAKAGMRAFPSGQVFNDPGGRFAFQNLDQNQSYRVNIESDGYVGMLQEELAAGDEQSPENVFELAPARPLTILVTDKESGTPISGASLIVDNTGSRNVPIWKTEVDRLGALFGNRTFLTTGENGIAHAKEGESPATILARAHGFCDFVLQPSERPQSLGPDGRVAIAMSRGGSISGVAYINGKLAADKSIDFDRSDVRTGTAATYSRGQRTDGAGRYRFDRLAPGRYNIEVRNDVGGFPETGISKRARLAAGEDLILNIGDDPAESAIFGVVTLAGEPCSRANIQIIPEFEWEYTSFGTAADSNGEYRIVGLRPGKYRFLVSPGILPGRDTSYGVEEIVSIGAAPTQHDFEFKKSNKVLAHLVFPPGFPAEIRGSINEAHLVWQKMSPENSAPASIAQIDRQSQSAIAPDGRVVFAGRFQGTFRLAVSAPVAGKTPRFFLVGDLVKIDNLQSDLDLGDLTVKFPAPSK